MSAHGEIIPSSWSGHGCKRTEGAEAARLAELRERARDEAASLPQRDTAARLAADLERVRQLLEQLEGKQEISRLLEGALAGSATKIFIGSENKLFSLSGSSVIAAPYRGGDGRVVGVVGVIGPTRLNYARVIPMVDFTAQTLSRLMR